MFRWTFTLATLVATSSFGQEASNWIGHTVVTVAPTLLRVEERVVDEDRVIRLYHVERAKDGWLWLTCEDVQGWVPANRVVQFEKAVDYYTRVLQSHPGTDWALWRRADLYFHEGENAKSLADCNELIRLHPEKAWGYGARGDLRLRAGNYPEAITDFNEAIRIDPKDWAAYEGRAFAEFRTGDYAAAETDYTTMIELVPGDASLYCNRGLVRLLRQKVDEAFNDFNEAIRIDPADKDRQGYKGRAAVYMRKQDYSNALINLDRALQVDPTDSNLRLNRGICCSRLRKFDDALADFSEAIGLKPDYVDAYNTRGELHLALYNYEEANRDFESVLRIAPKNIHALTATAWMRATCFGDTFRDGPRAVELATRACELDGWKDPKLLDTLAASYAEVGDFDKAIQWQEKAIAAHPQFEDKSYLRERLALFRRHEPLRGIARTHRN